ncbi:hypothetical protein G7054_g8324 [Neopestalotiopsis clavispora]|nr:hypothetical protein G7054_g8324 [Neopestalotiopsis clavispora]
MGFEIRSAAQECKSAFTYFCAQDASSQSWIRSAQGNFNLWCAELKVTSPDDTSTLDHRLRKKENVRNIIRDLLRGLSGALNKCRRLIDTIPEMEEEEEEEEREQHSHGHINQDTAGQAQSESDRKSPVSWHAISNESSSGDLGSSSENNAYAENSETESSALAEQARYILTIIEQLLRSSLVIREAGNKYRFQEADADFDGEAYDGFRKHLTAVILMAFPDPDAANLTAFDKAKRSVDHERLNTVQARLVHANLLRRNRILWNTRKSSLAPRIVTNLRPTEPLVVKKESNLVIESDSTASTHFSTHSETPSVIGSVSRPTSQAMKTTTKSLASARTATDVDSQLTGKHIFARRPSSTTTQMTRIGAKQTYPQSPKAASDGSLRCPYCNKVLPSDFQNRTRWRFDTAEQWEEHVALEHTNILPAENRTAFAQLNKRAMIEPLDCPLCPYAMHDRDTNIDDHILQHLHEFALRSLPERPNETGERESDISEAAGSMSHTRKDVLDDNISLFYPIYERQEVQKTMNQQWMNLHNSGELVKVPKIPWPPSQDPVAAELWNFHAQVVMEVLDAYRSLSSDGMRISTWKADRLEMRERVSEAIDQMSSSPQSAIMKTPLRALVTDRGTGTKQNRRRFEPLERIVVAIDFGTTYSGIAWASTEEPEKLNVVHDWGIGTRTANKAPTVLYYDNHGSTGSFKWGFQAQKEFRKGHKVHEWFKLGLCYEDENGRATTSNLNKRFASLTALPPLDKVDDYERLVVDYLKSIKYHMDEQLAEVDSQVPALQRTYVITAPSFWYYKEQNRIRSCAVKAGLGRSDQLQLISDPEAAAIWALERTTKLKLKVGDTFVVCDAGGGTVDLASYTIEALEPVIRLAGAAKGSGELCGSSYLNRILRKHLEARMRGYHGGWDQKYLDVAVNDFETTVKVEFTGDDGENHRILMPALTDSRRYGVKDGNLVLGGKELREIVFDPVIGRIQKLVEDQIANTPRPVKRVLLAGGFGQSSYLKQQLQLQPSIKHQGILVEHIDESDTSIVRGALIAGLTRHSQTQEGIRVPRPIVVSRIASKSFGTRAFESICNGSDRARAKMQPDGEYLVECMQWFIQEKSSIRDLVPNTFKFHKERSVYNGPIGEVTIDIYEFGDTLANDNSPPPRYPDEPGVKKCRSLTMDLTGMDVPIETHNGQPLYIAKFEILVILESASLSFSGRYNGKEFPAKKVKFD